MLNEFLRPFLEIKLRSSFIFSLFSVSLYSHKRWVGGPPSGVFERSRPLWPVGKWPYDGHTLERRVVQITYGQLYGHFGSFRPWSQLRAMATPIIHLFAISPWLWPEFLWPLHDHSLWPELWPSAHHLPNLLRPSYDHFDHFVWSSYGHSTIKRSLDSNSYCY